MPLTEARKVRTEYFPKRLEIERVRQRFSKLCQLFEMLGFLPGLRGLQRREVRGCSCLLTLRVFMKHEDDGQQGQRRDQVEVILSAHLLHRTQDEPQWLLKQDPRGGNQRNSERGIAARDETHREGFALVRHAKSVRSSAAQPGLEWRPDGCQFSSGHRHFGRHEKARSAPRPVGPCEAGYCSGEAPAMPTGTAAPVLLK